MNSNCHLMISCSFAASVFLLVSCADNSTTGPALNQRYPTTYARLSSDSLETLNELFSQANPRICTALNDFGFTVSWGTVTSCPRMRGRWARDPQIESLIDKAKVTLAQNSRFTGVKDPSSLSFSSARLLLSLQNDTLAFRVDFKPQIYQGLRVNYTDIRIMVDSVGIFSIMGNHYPEIFIPEPVVTPSQAQQSLLGEVIIWYDFGGAPREYVVSEESFSHDTLMADSTPGAVKMVLPHKTDKGNELRVVWRIDVDGPSWWMYVDIVTGELLLTEQLFIT